MYVHQCGDVAYRISCTADRANSRAGASKELRTSPRTETETYIYTVTWHSCANLRWLSRMRCRTFLAWPWSRAIVDPEDIYLPNVAVQYSMFRSSQSRIKMQGSIERQHSSSRNRIPSLESGVLVNRLILMCFISTRKVSLSPQTYTIAHPNIKSLCIRANYGAKKGPVAACICAPYDFRLDIMQMKPRLTRGRAIN